MRPVVVALVLFLVVLMSMLVSGAGPYYCPTLPDIKCKNGWRRLDKHRCIKAFPVAVTFDNAEHYCLQQRGNLVSVLSRYDNNVVACETFKASSKKTKYWIGGKRTKKGFEWLGGYGAMKFKFWRWYQPDNSGGHENCVETNYSAWGVWNDNKCWKKRPFICQTRM